MNSRKKNDSDLSTARIDHIENLVIDKLTEHCTPKTVTVSSSHLFGVADLAALLADMRGEDIELAYIAGLLHDLYKCTAFDVESHAEKGAAYAKPLLSGSGLFTDSEIEQVCGAIYFHSDKAGHHLPFDEILKDADVMQSVLSSGTCVVSKKQAPRWKKLRQEFGFTM